MTAIVQHNCGVSKHKGENLVLPCNHSVCHQCWFGAIVSGRANCAYCEFTSDDLHTFAEQKNTHGDTPLHNVIFSGLSEKIIEVLINKGADVNACNNSCGTPLHCAIMSGSSEKIIEVLINNGANVNARNNYGQTPLHYIDSASIDSTSIESIKLLIKHGANVNAKDNNGDVPLFSAFYAKVNENFSETQKIEVILELLKNGADIKMANNEGELPFEKAIDEGVCSADTIYNILKRTNADASILLCIKLLSKINNKHQSEHK
ncbi:Ankyrin repeat [Yasminevirus sp. GU-2018]|uniref:Ankyrin repeat n=1 Tax=Yasminevirus sp. GU-2018 TaxID=2420051 RepID=A0A5K0U7V7_9VIRU|nr:Ankyrin repeat [Yasminevirus sp. GU-2018]